MSADDGEFAVLGRQYPSSGHLYARTGRTDFLPSVRPFKISDGTTVPSRQTGWDS